MLKRHTEWVSSRELQVLILQNTGCLPRTGIRRLQEMVEDGDLDVQIRGKMAWYKAKDASASPKTGPQRIFIPGVGLIPN
jgi:hypothetical protein